MVYPTLERDRRGVARISTGCDAMKIGWMIRRDLPQVYALEEFRHQWDAWTEEKFLSYLRNKNTIGMVAEEDGKIVGFIVYELFKSKLEIIKLEAAAGKEQEVYRALIGKMKAKLSMDSRRILDFVVLETELSFLKYLKDEEKFVAKRVLRQFFETIERDGYLMRYSVTE